MINILCWWCWKGGFCLCVCLKVLMYVHTYNGMHLYTHTHTHIYIYIYIYIYTYFLCLQAEWGGGKQKAVRMGEEGWQKELFQSEWFLFLSWSCPSPCPLMIYLMGIYEMSVSYIYISCIHLVYIYIYIYIYIWYTSYIYIYIYIYIHTHIHIYTTINLWNSINIKYKIYVIHRQTVSLYHNSSVWLDTQDALSWDWNLPKFTLDLVSYRSAISRHMSARE